MSLFYLASGMCLTSLAHENMQRLQQGWRCSWVFCSAAEEPMLGFFTAWQLSFKGAAVETREEATLPSVLVVGDAGAISLLNSAGPSRRRHTGPSAAGRSLDSAVSRAPGPVLQRFEGCAICHPPSGSLAHLPLWETGVHLWVISSWVSGAVPWVTPPLYARIPAEMPLSYTFLIITSSSNPYLWAPNQTREVNKVLLIESKSEPYLLFLPILVFGFTNEEWIVSPPEETDNEPTSYMRWSIKARTFEKESTTDGTAQRSDWTCRGVGRLCDVQSARGPVKGDTGIWRED